MYEKLPGILKNNRLGKVAEVAGKIVENAALISAVPAMAVAELGRAISKANKKQEIIQVAPNPVITTDEGVEIELDATDTFIYQYQEDASKEISHIWHVDGKGEHYHIFGRPDTENDLLNREYDGLVLPSPTDEVIELHNAWLERIAAEQTLEAA